MCYTLWYDVNRRWLIESTKSQLHVPSDGLYMMT